MTSHVSPTRRTVRRQLETLLDSKDLEAVRTLLKAEHPADIADLLEMLGDAHRVALFDLLPPDAAAEVLDELSTRAMHDVVDAVPDEEIADLLEAMPVDDAAEVLSELRDDRAEDILALMEPDEAAEVKALLAYPEGTAGRVMTSKVVRVNEAWTVDETLQYLRAVDPEAETFAYLYAVNGSGKLVGAVPLRKLITAPASSLLAEILSRPVVSVRADADQEVAARLVAQYDFFAIPVVDAAERLLGIITHDDMVDILNAEFTEDMQRLGGSQPLEDVYLDIPVFTVVRKRVGWLLVLFLIEMLTGTVMRLFEGELQAAVALAFFVPLMIGTGGNSGSQTTSTIIRAIAIGEVRIRDTWRLLWHELRVGLMLGVVMAAVGVVRALTWGTGTPIAATVGAALLAIVLWANVIGALLPPLARRLRIDPAVISGPVMSTLVDATGLFIYFTLADSPAHPQPMSRTATCSLASKSVSGI